MLDPVVYPSFEQRRESTQAPGCPPYGEDSVLERPDACDKGPTASVRPGLVRPEAGTHAVTWWDPSALELDAEEEVGQRQQAILRADEGGVRSESGNRAHAQWQQRRSETLASGGTESIRLVRVVDLAAERRGEAKGVTVEEVGDRSGRPGGRRFGTLVHAVLAAIDLDADEAGVGATARTQGRIVGAAEDEIEAAARAAVAALAHPLLRRAAEAAKRGDLRRETPVLLRLEDGRLAEGIVDLALREKTKTGALWTVVDFKTDRELAGKRLEYEAQVVLYAEAIARATGETARGVLLIV
jgi:ATP-dependent exoDNAse (exonuclease V) beta subunit